MRQKNAVARYLASPDRSSLGNDSSVSSSKIPRLDLDLLGWQAGDDAEPQPQVGDVNGLAAKPRWRCLIPLTRFAEAAGPKGCEDAHVVQREGPADRRLGGALA